MEGPLKSPLKIRLFSNQPIQKLSNYLKERSLSKRKTLNSRKQHICNRSLTSPIWVEYWQKRTRETQFSIIKLPPTQEIFPNFHTQPPIQQSKIQNALSRIGQAQSPCKPMREVQLRTAIMCHNRQISNNTNNQT